MNTEKLKEIFDDQWWERACELYGIPEDQTREDYINLCTEKDGLIYTPTVEECIKLGIFTKHPELLP